MVQKYVVTHFYYTLFKVVIFALRRGNRKFPNFLRDLRFKIFIFQHIQKFIYNGKFSNKVKTEHTQILNGFIVTLK